MFILGTICCRSGSKNVPGKNVRELLGKPLIAHTIETALNCELMNDTIISTDDISIANIAKKFGANAPFLRPAELATDTASKWPVIVHAVENYERLTGKKVDYVVDMDVTVPLKTSADIAGAITMAITDSSVDVVITGYSPERNPYFNMMELSSDGYAQLVKMSEKPIVRRQDAPIVYSLTPAAFVIKRSALFGFEHWSRAKCKIYPMPRERSIDIDAEIDFHLVEFLMSQRERAKSISREIIES